MYMLMKMHIRVVGLKDAPVFVIPNALKSSSFLPACTVYSSSTFTSQPIYSKFFSFGLNGRTRGHTCGVTCLPFTP